MGHFVGDEVDRIDLGDNFWVDIKRRMNYGDQQKLVGQFIKLGIAGKEPTAELDITSTGITLLQLNIKAWNLTKDDDKVMPIGVESIIQLDPAIADRIRKEIDKRNPPPKA